MSENENTIDMDAARNALRAGQSLVDHLGLPADLPKVLYAIAVGHFEAKRYAEAKQCCWQLAALNPRFADAWALLGNCCMCEGEFADALNAWGHALYLKPNFSLAHEVARTAMALNDPQTAIVGLNAMRKHASSAEQFARYEELLGSLLESKGE